jgi:hypothetical protein
LFTFSLHPLAPQGQPIWLPWTPWSVCSASCGPARRHQHRFCAMSPSIAPSSLTLPSPSAMPTPLCPGPEAEEEPCFLPGCDRKYLPVHRLTLPWNPGWDPVPVDITLPQLPPDCAKSFHTPSSALPPGAGGWGPWGPWSSCSWSCGGGLRSRIRVCDQPSPQGLGDFCEGPQAQGEVCQARPCPGTCQGWGGVRE